MADRTALVTGATGFIGERLLGALLDEGWAVRACGRRNKPDRFPNAVEYREADLAGPDDLAPLLTDVTHVFHLAGASSSQSSEDEMHRGNVVATERLVGAAQRSKTLERMVYMSSTSVYGEEVKLPSPVEETVEPHPSRAYGQAKWASEQAVWAAGRTGVPVIIMRPVSVYGPGNVKLLGSAVLDAAIEHFAGHQVLPVPAAAVEQRLVHIDDVIRATLHLAVDPQSPGQAFNVVFPSYPSSHHVAELIAGELGMEIAVSDDPDCGLNYEVRSTAREQMLAAGMKPDILLTEERFRFMRKANPNNRLSIAALLSTGFQFKDPDLDTGIRATVAWYRDHRWIL
ncbi:MAG: NAD(P)-dependent oxidoreductase [Actinomycetota bacterium]|nr:NAD(P)-dependent oxidoreductase [Actinomycetota bacterium]